MCFRADVGVVIPIVCYRSKTNKIKKKKNTIHPDLFGFSQSAGLRVRFEPAVLFQVFGPSGRGGA